MGFQSLVERVWRGCAFFICELEGTPVVADGGFGAGEQETARGLIRVLVLVAHEPARGVGTDGQDGGADGTVFGGQVAVGAALVKAGVADVQDFAVRPVDDESGPERHGTVARAAGGPMVTGFKVDGQRA